MTARVAVALSLVAWLAACATPPVDELTVHIFSNQPDHPEVLATGEQLEAAGYRQRINYSETPGGLEVAETVIVHGESAGGYNRALALETLLAEPGESIRIERGGYGNHHFTAGNLGLYIHLPEPEREPEPDVQVHLAGTCNRQAVELFLRVDHSYRLPRQRWEDDYRLVDAGSEQGEWVAGGAGYELTSTGDDSWSLEPPLDADPAVNVYFVRGHPDFDSCRLAVPL